MGFKNRHAQFIGYAICLIHSGKLAIMYDFRAIPESEI